MAIQVINPAATTPSGVITTPGWDNGWKTAKLAVGAGTGNARIVAIGGSTVYGTASTNSNTKPWIAQIQQSLSQKGYPLQALMYPPCDAANWPIGNAWAGTAPWVLTAGFSARNGLFCRWADYAASATMPLLTFQPPVGVTELDAIYYDTTGSSGFTFQWQVDAGSIRTVTLAGSGSYKKLSGEASSADLKNLVAGNHTIQFGNASNSNTMRIAGGIAYPNGSTAKGLQIARCAVGSLGLAGTFGAGAIQPADACQQWQGAAAGALNDTSFGWPLGADLIIIDNAGDMASGVGIQTTSRVIDRMLKAFRRFNPNCSILLYTPCVSGDYSDQDTASFFGVESWLLTRRMITDVITAFQGAYVDFTQRWAGQGPTNGFQSTVVTDPTDAGHADMAVAIGSLL